MPGPLVTQPLNSFAPDVLENVGRFVSGAAEVLLPARIAGAPAISNAPARSRTSRMFSDPDLISMAVPSLLPSSRSSLSRRSRRDAPGLLYHPVVESNPE